ncbi:MAG: ferredoxin family protein [Chloroflexi bacterium]|nr:ferredoxin family protein [Chloroflexota bacterium]
MPPVIDLNECIGCGKCVDVCSEDVFFGTKDFGKSIEHKPVVTYPEVCWHCNLCVKACPVAGAIRLRIPLAMSVAYKDGPLGNS